MVEVGTAVVVTSADVLGIIFEVAAFVMVVVGSVDVSVGVVAVNSLDDAGGIEVVAACAVDVLVIVGKASLVVTGTIVVAVITDSAKFGLPVEVLSSPSGASTVPEQ